MKKAFTLIEVTIAILVFSVLSVGIFFLHRRGNAAFSITLWKQERAAQAEGFWTHFRKHVEEATDLLVIPDEDIGSRNPKIIKERDIPIKINSSVGVIDENFKGTLLSWNVSTLNFDFSEICTHTYSSKAYTLVKDGRKVYLQSEVGSKPIAALDDVSTVTIDYKKIVRPEHGLVTEPYEFVPDSPLPTGANVVGTLLEISMTMVPPKNYIGENTIQIPQNHKFKLNVAAEKAALP